jgi:transcriptional regulator of acetoin/glycerol metabolism
MLRVEKYKAMEALRNARGNVTEAAQALGMTRVGLYKLMKRHDLSREDVS